MQLTLELTKAQAQRVLTQATRSHARLAFDFRCDAVAADDLIGRLVRHERDLLCVRVLSELPEADRLIGACGDVWLECDGERYTFATCVIETRWEDGQCHLALAAPEYMQVLNRRRFERQAPAAAAQIRVYHDYQVSPYLGLLLNVSPTGLAARMPGIELDDLLLLGDMVRVRFELPGVAAPFELTAEVCNKAVQRRQQQCTLGLEFRARDADESERETLDRLRDAIVHQFADDGQDSDSPGEDG